MRLGIEEVSVNQRRKEHTNVKLSACFLRTIKRRFSKLRVRGTDLGGKTFEQQGQTFCRFVLFIMD